MAKGSPIPRFVSKAEMNNISARNGILCLLTSDDGTQFALETWENTSVTIPLNMLALAS